MVPGELHPVWTIAFHHFNAKFLVFILFIDIYLLIFETGCYRYFFIAVIRHHDKGA